MDNKNSNSPLDWRKELDFWFEKEELAEIRYNDAIRRGDEDDMKIALDQMRLYYNRKQACIPKEVREGWEKQEKEKILKAFKEME